MPAEPDFAIDELARGRAYDDGVSEPDLYFPLLPKNADELKRTSLYTDPLFPTRGASGPSAAARPPSPSNGSGATTRTSSTETASSPRAAISKKSTP